MHLITGTMCGETLHSDHSILSTNELLDSMRYGGYRSPATALAELIDNSFEAKGNKIDVVCIDEIDYSMKNTVERLHDIVVIDNGEGMTKDVLWNALRFGVGTRRERKGIGRFGMGLPYASMSQCRRVDVYTWQKSGEVFRTYLDLDYIQKNNKRQVPEPEQSKIPKEFKKFSNIISPRSGTIVVWSNLDRCIWKKSSTLISKSEQLIGRVYRKFLAKGALQIRMVRVTGGNVEGEYMVRPNDPLYLMENSSTPKPWNNECMFTPDGEVPDENIMVKDNLGMEHKVVIRFALAKDEARHPKGGQKAGALRHGKHAQTNLGVSVLRDGRELNMDQNLIQTYNPLERWWGVEIDFPPALDEFFGITNNKQDATNFSAMTKHYIKVQDDERVSDYESEDANSDEKMMSSIVKKMLARIRSMRRRIKAQEEGRKSPRDERHHASNTFTAKTERRMDEGHVGTTDLQIKEQTKAERVENVKRKIEGHVPPSKLDQEASDIVDAKERVRFQEGELNGSLLFDISLSGGVEIITINTTHNAYKNLLSVVEDLPNNMTVAQAVSRFKNAKGGLRLLLSSWARMEDEESNEKKRKALSNTRFKWGEIMDEFFDI